MSDVTGFDVVSQYVDHGDHTVAIDPIRNSSWIHAGQTDKHLNSMHRNRTHDAISVEETESALSRALKPDAKQRYTPSSGTLDSMPGYASRKSDQDVWRGETRRVHRHGRFPVVQQLHRDQRLNDIPKAYIDEHMYRNRRNVLLKAFSKAGVPDHGIPGYDYWH